MGKKRTSFYFPEEAADRVIAIQRRSWLDSPAAVIRAAIGAFSDLVDVTLSGYKIFVRDPAGIEWTYCPHGPLNCPAFAAPGDEPQGASSAKLPKNFVFSEEVTGRIESMRRRSHLQSNADVIRVALLAYDDLTRVVAAGGDILIRSRDGVERCYTPYAPLLREGLELRGGYPPTSQPTSRRPLAPRRAARAAAAPLR
jgi:hypothetical protein